MDDAIVHRFSNFLIFCKLAGQETLYILKHSPRKTRHVATICSPGEYSNTWTLVREIRGGNVAWQYCVRYWKRGLPPRLATWSTHSAFTCATGLQGGIAVERKVAYTQHTHNYH